MKQSFVLISLFMVGCATYQPKGKLPYEQAYIKRIAGYPETFRVHKSFSDQMWARAQVFVRRYSSTKVSVSNDNLIETYSAPVVGSGYSYTIDRVPVGDSVEFSVRCIDANGQPFGQAKINRWSCTDYIATGYTPVESVLDQGPRGDGTTSLERSQERLADTVTVWLVVSVIASLASIVALLVIL